MKLFFAEFADSSLLNPSPQILYSVRDFILENNLAEEVRYPDDADAIIVQENMEYKDYRYVANLLNDSFISRNMDKIFTISLDDSATGILRGLYSSIPKKRFDYRYHRAVPFFDYVNEFVFEHDYECEPNYLAGWYGNVKSSRLRRELFNRWSGQPDFYLKKTESWYDHNEEEKREYVQLVKSAYFSLCPKGWAPPSPRIYESMALGKCPVIISDQFVPPKGPNWCEFSLCFPEKNLNKLEDFLRLHQGSAEKLGAKAKSEWDRYFAGDLMKSYYTENLISLIQSSPRATNDSEKRRWQSFSTYWTNNWSIPQRLTNKTKKILTTLGRN